MDHGIQAVGVAGDGAGMQRQFSIQLPLAQIRLQQLHVPQDDGQRDAQIVGDDVQQVFLALLQFALLGDIGEGGDGAQQVTIRGENRRGAHREPAPRVAVRRHRQHHAAHCFTVQRAHRGVVLKSHPRARRRFYRVVGNALGY